MIGPDNESSATAPPPPEQHQRRAWLRPAAIGIGLIIVVGLVIGGASALGFATGWSKAAGGDRRQKRRIPGRQFLPAGDSAQFGTHLHRPVGHRSSVSGVRAVFNTFPSGDKSLHAWDGDEGWNAFLAATLGGLVQNVLRQEIGTVTCADLVALCTLAQNSTEMVVPTDGNGNQTIAQVQQAVNSGFAADVQNILGCRC